MTGSAAELPYPDDSYDSVGCFTMLHHVPTLALQNKILAEALRVLRPGGVFLYTDARSRRQCPEWEAALDAAPLRLVSCRDIGKEVLRWMELNSAQTKALRKRLGMIGAVVSLPARDSPLYRNLESGRLLYRMYLLTKAT